MGIFDKAKDAVSGHQDQVDRGVDKAGDAVDQRTGGQHAEQVDKGQDAVRDRLGAGGDPATENTPPG
ncbi:antitoxin [Auraticoccus sp. F435]|uniref:Antitoxin n=1 Tax=Auraticoccus cholistanensis TaxID=2656650 RepID=A0A6A9UXI3_9ACTN|nr:antitoxin [Auraticoccus cholistanensis]MVA77441.1 antitoxin [Auraticoccus cholistanensis]